MHHKIYKKHGLKLTKQRMLIMEVVSNSEDHPDIEEIYRRACNKDETISIATVYRTVNLFKQLKIIKEHNFGDNKASRYELVTEGDDHDHLIDVDNGHVVEFHNSDLSLLLEKIAKGLGYKLSDYKLELYCKKIKD